MHDFYPKIIVSYFCLSKVVSYRLIFFSPLNQRFDPVLKSPILTVKKGLLVVAMSIFNSKLVANASKSSCHWLGKRYKDKNLHNLPPIQILKLSHSCKYGAPRIFNGREFP